MLATAPDRIAFHTLTDLDLTSDISFAHTQLTHFKARFIIAVAEFDERGLASTVGAPSTAIWLQRAFGVSRTTAFEYLGVGRRLRAFPLLSTAFLAAELSYSVVRLLLRYLTGDNEAELVDLAKAHPYSELILLLAGRDQPDVSPVLNKINVVTDPETGEVRIWGRFDPERGAEIKAALKISELANLIDIEGIDQAVLDDPEQVSRLIDEARAPEAESATADSKPDYQAREPGSRTRFGAVGKQNLFTAFMGLIHMARSHPLSRVRAPGAEVNVLFTQDNRAYIPGHHGGQTGQLLRSVLNGGVRFHLLSRDGLTLKVTRATRLATSAQVKALLSAWGYQCAGPGCDHTRFLEFHHIVPWAEGGATELSNLIPLCSGCHSLVTAGLMTIHVDGETSFLRFRLPGGESFTSENRGLTRTNESMGRWGDRYHDGPVPLGDEELLQVWDDAESFDDPAEPAGDQEDQSMR